MNLTEMKLSEIKVEDRAREDYGDIEALAEAIKEKGLIQPIVVDQYKRLLAGGRRLEAFKLLKRDVIPAITLDTSGKIDRLEIELYENIYRSDLKWPEQARLEKQIYDLKMDKDSSWSHRKQAAERGKSHTTIDRRILLAEALDLLPELAQHDTEDAAWKEYKRLEEGMADNTLRQKIQVSPEVAQARRFAEDHFKIGDALEEMAKLDGGKADFAEVDPPYAVSIKELKARAKDNSTMKHYTEIADKDYPAFLKEAAAEVYRLLKPNSYCVWWHGSVWHHTVYESLKKAGFEVSQIPAIWYKGQVGQASQPDVALASCYEPFFVCRKGKPKLHKAGRSNVFHVSPIPAPKKTHGTEKPVALMVELLDTFCLAGSSVLCPFLGSGATLRAAYKLGFTGWGYDLEESHKEVFLRKVMEDVAAAEESEAA